MNCRFCGNPLHHLFACLGPAPLANSYLTRDQMDLPEPFYPLDARVCDSCFLVQLPEFAPPEHIFSDYAYFSSYSDTWLEHCRLHADRMTELLSLGPRSLVVEVGSNDGCLLQYFRRLGVPVLGIEPAGNVAKQAEARGISTLVEFFGTRTARRLKEEGRGADLLVGNNVLAHVPDLNDFVEGIRVLLKPGGTVTMEFPHLEKLVDNVQFDTIYHEHFSYFSFLTVRQVFASHGMSIFDVEELPTHGGSLRIHACGREYAVSRMTGRPDALEKRERDRGYAEIGFYAAFRERVENAKREILSFLIEAKRAGRSIAGYGAPAKGNTLLNYCGIRTDFIPYTVDRNPRKQGRFLPGSRIPVEPPERIAQTRPDYLIIFPWNIRDEIIQQMAHIRDWGGKFVTLIPGVEIL